jgi:hypothetical protein
MAKETEPFTWTRWGITHANKHATAASTYLQKLSQATDLHDRAKAHAEFVQMHIDMCNERAKVLSDAVAAASNFMGAFVPLLQRHKHLHNMARNSPTFREIDGEERKRNWSAAKRSKARPKR